MAGTYRNKEQDVRAAFGPVEVVELLQGQIPQGHRTNVRVSKRAASVGSW